MFPQACKILKMLSIYFRERTGYLTYFLSPRAMWRRASFWVGNSNTADTVYVYVDYEPKDNEFLKDVKGCAIYMEIKDG